MDLIQNFFISGAFREGMNNTNLVLILKKKQCQTLVDYRLIALCNVVYKEVVKILANILWSLLDSLIFDIRSLLLLEDRF